MELKDYLDAKRSSWNKDDNKDLLFLRSHAGKDFVRSDQLEDISSPVLNRPEKPSIYTEGVSEEVQILLGPGRWVLSAPGFRPCAAPGLETLPGSIVNLTQPYDW